MAVLRRSDFARLHELAEGMITYPLLLRSGFSEKQFP
jgi:hypothetical protein